LTTLLDQIRTHGDRVLIRDAHGEYTARELLSTASWLARRLGPTRSPGAERIAVLASPGLGYVAALLACWQRRAMAVPLCPEHPPAEMSYVLEDGQVTAVLSDDVLSALLPATSLPAVTVPATVQADPPDAPPGFLPLSPEPDDIALMLYTSGTTGRPKGVVHTHRSVSAQITCLVEAWEWTADDRIPHFLPLHHTHGIVNKLFCPLWVGARCDMLPRFEPVRVLDLLAEAHGSAEPFTVFMGVPTIYAKLIQAWEAAAPAVQARWSAACRDLRLMVSGSAALAMPISVMP
jgi:malonyl-CoA/methylmalonyl-CoA synthetase